MSLEDIIRIKYNHLKYINVSRTVFSNIHCNWVTALFNNDMQPDLQRHSKVVCKKHTKILIKQYCDTVALDDF